MKTVKIVKLERTKSAFSDTKQGFTSGINSNYRYSNQLKKPVPSVTEMPNLNVPLKSILKAPSLQAVFLIRASMMSSEKGKKKKGVSFGGKQVKNY